MSIVAHPMGPVLVFAFVAAAALCGPIAVGAAPSRFVDLVLSYGWAFTFLIWMNADARRTRRLPCFDFGLFAIVSFPLSLVWYCFWSRGWRGTFLLLALLALWLTHYLVSNVLILYQY